MSAAPCRWPPWWHWGGGVAWGLHLLPAATAASQGGGAAQQPVSEQDVPQHGGWPGPAAEGGGPAGRRGERSSTPQPPPPPLLLPQPGQQPVVLLAVVLLHSPTLQQHVWPAGRGRPAWGEAHQEEPSCSPHPAASRGLQSPGQTHGSLWDTEVLYSKVSVK